MAAKAFYTAKEAQAKLGVSPDRFQYLVRKGTVKKVIIPGRKYGVYPQADINRLASVINATLEQYANDTTTFEVATESDLPEIYAMCSRTMPRVTPVEVNLRWMQRNHEAFYVLRDNGELVAYTCLFPIDYDWLERVLRDEVRISDVPIENIHPFEPEVPIDVYIRDLIVGRTLDREKATRYGMRLILELIHVITQLGRRGMNIRMLYAFAGTPDGNRVCQRLGFTPMPELGPFPRYFMPYKLDVEHEKSPLTSEYRDAFVSFQAERAYQNEKSMNQGKQKPASNGNNAEIETDTARR